MKFYRDSDGTTYAVSSYAGKTVKAKAKRNPNDADNPEYGERLAKARCDVKVASKRVDYYENEFTQLCRLITKLYDKKIKYERILEEAYKTRKEAREILADVENEVR